MTDKAREVGEGWSLDRVEQSVWLLHILTERKNVLETGLCIIYPVQNLNIMTSSESLAIQFKRSKRTLFGASWEVLVYFSVLKSAKVLNIILKNEQHRSKR